MASEIFEKALSLRAYMADCKRRIHRHPELGMQEFGTAEFVRSELEKMGVEFQPLDTKVGVVGIIRGTGKGSEKVIGLRADMDALPIQETPTEDGASEVPGVMHACGHDAHTAMLLGAARMLMELRSRFSGTVKLIFQPAEETLGGSELMIKLGALENPHVDVMLGQHGIGEFHTGDIAFREGPSMASSDTFSVTVRGVGGHGAYPHRSGADPLLAAANCVMALQGLVTRSFNAVDPMVLSICTFQGGTAKNVIPDEVTFGGTVRCQSPESRGKIEAMMNRMIGSIVAGYGCTHELNYIYGVPPLVNDSELTKKMRAAAAKLLGDDHVRTMEEPRMGSEDYACYCEKVKQSCFARLGIWKEGQPQPKFHNGAFRFDDDALPVGAGFFVQAVLELNGQ
ncbi:MAG: M20 metallopeptidase family protein [Pyramidobacter sp.]|jgi:amidohydrolase